MEGLPGELLPDKARIELARIFPYLLNLAQGVLGDTSYRIEPADVNVAGQKPRLSVRTTQNPDGQVLAGKGRDHEFIQNAAAVPQRRRIVEHPNRVLTTESD